MYIILYITVYGRTVCARPRTPSLLPQRLSVDRHAGPDGQRQSAVLADVAVPAGGRPVPRADGRAPVPDADATCLGGCRDRTAARRRLQVRPGQAVQRRLELRDHRQHRPEGDKRVGRTHVSWPGCARLLLCIVTAVASFQISINRPACSEPKKILTHLVYTCLQQ